MQDFQIGGCRLVYQGENPDYMEEESWKAEGFLPFGKEAPGAAGGLQGAGENGDTGSSGSEEDGPGEEDCETADGFVFIEDDGDLPFAVEDPVPPCGA